MREEAEPYGGIAAKGMRGRQTKGDPWWRDLWGGDTPVWREEAHVERGTCAGVRREEGGKQGGRGLPVYRGDLEMRTNERFALFDIRHDFIKHSSNVQTLYIELYSRVPLLDLSPSPVLPPRRLRTLSTHRMAGYVLLSGGAAYNENIVAMVELVMPQYRIMYNYIIDRRRSQILDLWWPFHFFFSYFDACTFDIRTLVNSSLFDFLSRVYTKRENMKVLSGEL